MTPLELITKGTWDHALFTTYALSLSFYETQLHKLGLARNGCRDIRILTDLDGYQLSLSERQSHRIGNEYQVTPVALPSGVFHPKLTWLAGKEVDLLLIGSGNLTFGGFGKNLECLDIIRSDKNPAFFSQVGELFTRWATRKDLKFAENEWFEFWITRAGQISSGSVSPDVSTPILLHTTNDSIEDQLLEHVEQRGEVAEVRSLSPFFDPTGDGILSFAESVLAEKLTIGLLPGREDKSSFPFTRNRKSPIKISASLFIAPEDKRHLHAKVLEVCFVDGSSLLVTGSVNATHKSFRSSDNIEAAVLRFYPADAPRPFEWNPTEIPKSYQKAEFRKAGLGNRVVVSAKLTGEGKIEGSLISKKGLTGIWESTLQRMDGVIAELSLSVNASGHFSAHLNNPEWFQHATGLQLRVVRDEQEGTGWVNVEGLLMAAKRGFLNPSTLLKLLGSEADEDDETELLRYLATSAQRHLPVFTSDRRPTLRAKQLNETEQGKGASSIHVPLQMLNVADLRDGNRDAYDESHREDAMLNTYMSRIRHNLLCMHKTGERTEDVDEISDDKASKREEKERHQRRKQLENSLSEFQRKMDQLVSSLPSGTNRCAALCMWFEVAFSMLLNRLNEPDEVEMFMKRWVSKAIAGQKYSKCTQVLSGHILSTLLTLTTVQMQRVDEGGKKALGSLHEQLESFCEGNNPKSLCEELEVLDSTHPPLAKELLKILQESPSLSDALAEIMETPTPRQQLDLILKVPSDQSALSELPILNLPTGKKLLSLVRSGHPLKMKDLHPTDHVCPLCHLKLRPATLLEVKRDRFGFCRNCNGLLLATI